MTTTTLRQDETIPAEWPVLTSVQAVEPEAIWQRIEAYVAHRWTPRAVTWTVEGCGEWVPPLTPAAISTVERWTGDAWETVTLPASPMGGYVLPGGIHRFTGTAGASGAEMPPAVIDAYRRLAAYMSQKTGKAGATRESVTAGSVSISTSRSATWQAQAMQLSGAGDLLRPYRRAG